MSESSNPLSQTALTELAGVLMSTSSFEEVLQRVAELAARAIPAALTCGITLAEDGHVLTVASADALALQLDEQQYELGEGPCLQALSTAEIVSTWDLARETRWDGYPARALAHGVSTIYSSPLMVNDEAIGALNMYAGAVDAFDSYARTSIALLTALAAATITAAMRHYDQTALSDHLRSALSSRSVIDQAMGIVMGMQQCGPGEAFDLLRKVSQNRNIKLRDVAVEMVTNTARPPGERRPQ